MKEKIKAKGLVGFKRNRNIDKYFFFVSNYLLDNL